MSRFHSVTIPAMVLSIVLCSCAQRGTCGAGDSVPSIPEGEFTYNMPCKVVGIHQEKKGKSIMFLWLHGGVHDTSKHDFYGYNHLDCCDADDSVLCYLNDKGIKAIALFPLCHLAEVGHPVDWADCYEDVRRIMDDYISKGMIDTDRIYLAGSSDGGCGTWDFVEEHEDIFAAAMPMSCERPRKCTIPVYFFNTSDEEDCTAAVDSLRAEGYTNISYKRCYDQPHGGDATECTVELLDRYFSHTR